MQKELNSIWGGWVIKELLGEGSFGKVYRIEREDFGHLYEAALKVISIPKTQAEVKSVLNDGMDEKSVTMYFRSIVEDIVEEFVLMSKLKGNTNIVSYEDHAVVPHENEIGWNIYIRMELLTPLFDYLRENTLSVRDVIRLGIDMCQALEVCQKFNIIHRDIKPENIFVSNLGKFKLGDFGIARQLEKTSSGLSKKGTYTYMAPEVYKGDTYNSSVDIYSLGIVLYRFLNNNRAPFLPAYPNPIRYADKEKANVLRMGGTEMPVPCNAKGRLAEIVLKACAYNPKERYESAVA
ncbi:MAG: serine/threonine-protein kinase, partial [Lachnospiraceae bacterium]|nr:serine/threonine-protein kinase [Lachnospiraceae bacterium]